MGLFSNTTPDILKGVQAVVNVVSVLNGVGTRTDTEKILQADPKQYEAADLFGF